MTVSTAEVLDALREVIDPDLGVNVVDLGFVRDIDLDAVPPVLTMTLTSPACPLPGVPAHRRDGGPDVDGARGDVARSRGALGLPPRVVADAHQRGGPGAAGRDRVPALTRSPVVTGALPDQCFGPGSCSGRASSIVGKRSA